AHVVVAETHVHQAGHTCARIRVPVVVDALNKRRRAVADANDGYLHAAGVAHAGISLLVIAGVVGDVERRDNGASRRQSTSALLLPRCSACSCAISSLSQRTSRSLASSPSWCSSRM